MRADNLPFNEILVESQKLYNEDKGESMQREILELILQIIPEATLFDLFQHPLFPDAFSVLLRLDPYKLPVWLVVGINSCHKNNTCDDACS